MAQKNKSTTRTASSRRWRFLTKQKNLLALSVVVLAFTGLGSYLLGTSSAAINYNINYCHNHGPTLTTTQNAKNPCVREVQGFLDYYTHDVHYGTPGITPGIPNLPWCNPKGLDGTYGADTSAAVKCFQKNYINKASISPANGTVNLGTYNFMNDICKLYTNPNTDDQSIDSPKVYQFCWN